MRSRQYETRHCQAGPQRGGRWRRRSTRVWKKTTGLGASCEGAVKLTGRSTPCSRQDGALPHYLLWSRTSVIIGFGPSTDLTLAFEPGQAAAAGRPRQGAAAVSRVAPAGAAGSRRKRTLAGRLSSARPACDAAAPARSRVDARVLATQAWWPGVGVPGGTLGRLLSSSWVCPRPRCCGVLPRQSLKSLRRLSSADGGQPGTRQWSGALKRP